MSSRTGPLLLDTSIVVHLARANTTGQEIDRAFGLSGRKERPLISIVSVGELYLFAARGKWGDAKKRILARLIGELVVVDIQSQPILEAYAEIGAYCESIGRKLGNNDLWIAATARVTGALLLTNDKDFDPLHGGFLQRVYLDPNAGSSP